VGLAGEVDLALERLPGRVPFESLAYERLVGALRACPLRAELGEQPVDDFVKISLRRKT
jgi:hypothetical protein